jgi:hypothetical protein
MLLYPTDWVGVVKALEGVEVARADEALGRYEESLRTWARTAHPGAAPRGQPSQLDEQALAEHRKFADGLADRALHLLRGDKPRLTRSLRVTIVDDDIGGPYLIPPRDVFARALGARVPRVPSSGSSSVVLVYAEPRSWKGRAALGERTLAQLARVAGDAALVVLFAHPRLAAQIPGDAPILCAWHGMALMQRAAARWV